MKDTYSVLQILGSAIESSHTFNNNLKVFQDEDGYNYTLYLIINTSNKSYKINLNIAVAQYGGDQIAASIEELYNENTDTFYYGWNPTLTFIDCNYITELSIEAVRT
jgi:hypothetical protein